MHLADGSHHLLGLGVLQKIAHCTRFDRRKDLVVGGKAGQHQDTSLWMAGYDLPDRFDSVHLWHHQVHQGDVGLRAFYPADSLLAVAGLPDHLDTWLQSQQGTDPLAHDGMILGDKDADRI